MTLLVTVGMFILIIFIHELSHLLMGYWLKSPPAIFSVGFGKPWCAIQIKQTEFRFAPILLGGYVSWHRDLKRSMDVLKELSAWKQIFIYASGCIGNAITAFVIMVYMAFQILQTDIITATRVSYMILSEYIAMLFYYLSAFVRPEISTVESLGGMGTIYIAVREAMLTGHEELIFLFVILSLTIAILNLIPIPPLDGGHIAQTVIEYIIGRRFSYRANVFLMYLGVALILIIFATATYSDIRRLFFM